MIKEQVKVNISKMLIQSQNLTTVAEDAAAATEEAQEYGNQAKELEAYFAYKDCMATCWLWCLYQLKVLILMCALFGVSWCGLCVFGDRSRLRWDAISMTAVPSSVTPARHCVGP